MVGCGADLSVRFECIDENADFLRLAVLDTSSLTEDIISSMVSVLDDERRSIVASIRSAPHRRDVIAAHFLLRRLLEESLGIPSERWSFGTTELGRPIIISPAAMSGIRVSLSHARGFVAVAIARGYEVGVDVERTSTDPFRLYISDRFFASDEAAYLRGLDADLALEAITALWTLKEAFVKAIGKGFWQPFRSFSISLSEPIRVTFSDPVLNDPASWRFWRESHGEFRLALAYSSLASDFLRPDPICR